MDTLAQYVRKTRTCWWWLKSKNELGYGKAYYQGKQYKAHRIVYELMTGIKPPDHLVSDHLCNNPSCVNPKHIEFVTQGENARRMSERMKTCRKGHSRGKENMGQHSKNRPYLDCLTCRSEHAKKSYKRHRRRRIADVEAYRLKNKEKINARRLAARTAGRAIGLS